VKALCNYAVAAWGAGQAWVASPDRAW